MRLTPKDMQQMRRLLPGLTMDAQGDPVAPQDATEAQIVASVNYADKMRSEDDVAHKFWIGALINRLPASANKVEYCRDLFGEHRGKEFYDIAWVVSRWSHNPRVGWKWGHYKASAGASLQQQNEYAARWKREKTPVRKIEQECAARTALRKRSDALHVECSEAPPYSTIVPLSYIYVEYAGARFRVPIGGGAVHIVDDDDRPTAQVRQMEETLFSQFVRCLASCDPQQICLDIQGEEESQEEE